MVEDERAEPSYLAVGIPQGIIVDRSSGEVAGAVRRGGELVSLDRTEYALWTLLLSPMTLSAATEIGSVQNWDALGRALERLDGQDLIAPVGPGSALQRLRPLPLGFGLGNSAAEPTTFRLQDATLSLPSPVVLDVVEAMIWWEFDGAKTLGEIGSCLAGRLPDLSSEVAGAAVIALVHRLMASRLLYLDGPSMPARA